MTTKRDCECCVGVDADSPRRVENPPGLTRINYRIGRHGEFLDTITTRLSSVDNPALGGLTTREASDFTLAIADAVSSSLDVLSFYTERFAHEHYLRTATERMSVLEMARLIGYQLAPGVAAGTHLAFTLQNVPGVPVEPIEIPIGTRVQSVPGQDEQAQAFETVSTVPARAEWNAIAAKQSEEHVPTFGDTELWLNGIDTGLDIGDHLLIVGAEHENNPSDERWDVRVISEVIPDAKRNLTRVRWLIGLGHTHPFVLPAGESVRVFTFRTRSSVFGSNAPDWRALSDDTKADYIGLNSVDDLQRPGDTEEWPDFSVLAPEYPERRQAGGIGAETHFPATLDDVMMAANGAAQHAVTAAMHTAARNGGAVIAAGNEFVDGAVSLARKTAEGLQKTVRLAADEFSAQARNLILSQGEALMALTQAPSDMLFLHALGRARLAVEGRLGNLAEQVASLQGSGISSPVEIAQSVLDELIQDLTALAADEEVLAGVPDHLSSAWQAGVTKARDAVQTVKNNEGNWVDAALGAVPQATQALNTAVTELSGLAADAPDFGTEAGQIVNTVISNLSTKLSEAGFSTADLQNLLDPSQIQANVANWSQNLFTAGGSVFQMAMDLQKQFSGYAAAIFSQLGSKVGRIADGAVSVVSQTGQLLNPLPELESLSDRAVALREQSRLAAVGTLRTAAAADVAALVTTAVTLARNLPAPFPPPTPESIAEVVRFFAAYGVARAGGNPVSEPVSGSLLAAVKAAMPAGLLLPFDAAEPIISLLGDADELLGAPRSGAEAAYQQISVAVDKALLGKFATVPHNGRREPFVRLPDTIDVSPVNDAVVADNWALLSVPNSLELYRISDVTTASRAEYLLSGQTTRLQLSGELPDGRIPAEFEHAVRSLSVLVESEELSLAKVPLEFPVYGEKIALDGHYDGLLPAQAIALRGRRQRILMARGAKAIAWQSESGETRLLNEGDSLLLMAAPERLQDGTPEYLPPREFSETVGDASVTLHLLLQDRDGQTGDVELRGSDIVLTPPYDDDEEVSEVAFLVNTDDAVSHNRDRSLLKLDAAVRNCYARAPLRINANVAPATHGETVESILGSGDASAANQSFVLNQSPLTFVSANTPSGRASSLEVRVNDVLWTKFATLYNSEPEERRYAIQQNDDAVTTVLFGDGIEGSRLPSGESNIRVKYRKGLGIAGNLAKDKLTTLLSRPLGVSEVTNPDPASGGEDPETLDAARGNAPLTVLTLDRAVSIKDYANFARAFAGIDKAHALWIPAGPARGVFLSIAGIDGALVPESSDTFRNLALALATYGDPLVPLSTHNYRDARFHCRLSVKVLAEYETNPVLDAVDARLRENFSFANRAFGQTVSVDEVAAVAQSVEGVEAVHVTKLYRSGDPPNLVPRLFATLPVASLTQAPDAAELLILADQPTELEVLP